MQKIKKIKIWGLNDYNSLSQHKQASNNISLQRVFIVEALNLFVFLSEKTVHRVHIFRSFDWGIFGICHYNRANKQIE